MLKIYNWIRRTYLYCWSICAFSILLSLALLFWNQILICVSVSRRDSASSNLRPLEMYSFLWYSSSKRRVCSLENVVLCLRGLPSFLLLRATAKNSISCSKSKVPRHTHVLFSISVKLWHAWWTISISSSSSSSFKLTDLALRLGPLYHFGSISYQSNGSKSELIAE